MSEPQETQRPQQRTAKENLAHLRAWRAKVAHEPAGAKMPDGSIYVGALNGKRLYTLPRNAKASRDFNAAAAYAQKANEKKKLGHDDWRVPTKEELNFLYENRETGALKGTFDLSDTLEFETDGDYWSSTRVGDRSAYMKQFDDGAGCTAGIGYNGIVRLVR